MTRVLRIFSTALITAGLVVLADVVLTLVWQEPVSSVYAAVQQNDAEEELEELESEFPSPEDLEAIERVSGVRAKIEVLAERFSDQVRRGRAIGRIENPEMDLDAVVVQGTDEESLHKGPGHYPETAFPGQGRTVAIAGHRTTYLAPFHDIDKVEKGDEIGLQMPYAGFTYKVTKTRIVDPGQIEVVDDVGYDQLVLTACHPLYSAAQRYVVFAKLEDASLFAAGTRRWLDP